VPTKTAIALPLATASIAARTVSRPKTARKSSVSADILAVRQSDIARDEGIKESGSRGLVAPKLERRARTCPVLGISLPSLIRIPFAARGLR
jgi:DNA-binding IclR family transcriptional regulator